MHTHTHTHTLTFFSWILERFLGEKRNKKRNEASERNKAWCEECEEFLRGLDLTAWRRIRVKFGASLQREDYWVNDVGLSHFQQLLLATFRFQSCGANNATTIHLILISACPLPLPAFL